MHAFLWFKESGILETKIARAHVWFYGLGQGVFGLGMVIAGFYGVQRKTYGVEQIITEPVARLGMGVMGIGGICAIFGALLFLILVLRRTKRLS
jgi:heme/copper-type cytochrome/quinol oxidase subunit 1